MNLWVIPVIFVAMLIQSIAGFGSGLIAMPFLIAILGLSIAAPAFAIMGFIGGSLIAFRYRQSFQLADIWRTSLTGVMMIPIGIWGAQQLPQHIMLMLLGIVTIAYAAYNLAGLAMPDLTIKTGYVFGVASGLLQGAYNTGGPPLVMFGNSQRWQPERFKCNLQMMFLINGIVVILTHAISHNITWAVWQYVALMLPVMALALTLGFWLDRFIEPKKFRIGVLILLLAIGIKLII